MTPFCVPLARVELIDESRATCQNLSTKSRPGTALNWHATPRDLNSSILFWSVRLTLSTNMVRVGLMPSFCSTFSFTCFHVGIDRSC